MPPVSEKGVGTLNSQEPLMTEQRVTDAALLSNQAPHVPTCQTPWSPPQQGHAQKQQDTPSAPRSKGAKYRAAKRRRANEELFRVLAASQPQKGDVPPDHYAASGSPDASTGGTVRDRVIDQHMQAANGLPDRGKSMPLETESPAGRTEASDRPNISNLSNAIHNAVQDLQMKAIRDLQSSGNLTGLQLSPRTQTALDLAALPSTESRHTAAPIPFASVDDILRNFRDKTISTVESLLRARDISGAVQSAESSPTASKGLMEMSVGDLEAAAVGSENGALPRLRNDVPGEFAEVQAPAPHDVSHEIPGNKRGSSAEPAGEWIVTKKARLARAMDEDRPVAPELQGLSLPVFTDTDPSEGLFLPFPANLLFAKAMPCLVSLNIILPGESFSLFPLATSHFKTII